MTARSLCLEKILTCLKSEFRNGYVRRANYESSRLTRRVGRTPTIVLRKSLLKLTKFCGISDRGCLALSPETSHSFRARGPLRSHCPRSRGSRSLPFAAGHLPKQLRL